MSRKFRVGDKVRVVGMSPVTFAPGVKDELGTEKLFKSMLGKVYTVRGFDRYGNVELRPKLRDAVWVEPEFLKLRARRPKRKLDSALKRRYRRVDETMSLKVFSDYAPGLVDGPLRHQDSVAFVDVPEILTASLSHFEWNPDRPKALANLKASRLIAARPQTPPSHPIGRSSRRKLSD